MQSKKYIKRSELERVCTQPEVDDEEKHSTTPEKGEGSKGGATLMSPTTLTSMEGSAALFSIPMSEVQFQDQGACLSVQVLLQYLFYHNW